MVEHLPAPQGSASQIEVQLQRAETLARITSQVRFDQPINTIRTGVSQSIVAETEAVAAALMLLGRGDLAAIAMGSCGLPEGYLEAMVATHSVPARAASLRAVFDAGETYVARDARAVMREVPEFAHLNELIDEAQFDTYVTIPFSKRAGTIGIVCLYYAAQARVDEQELAFARAVAEQASPTMDNALLFSQMTQRTSELEALYRADEALHQSLELDDVLQAMVNLAVELLGASSSLVVTFDDAGRLGVRKTRGVRADQREGIHERYQRFDREHYRQFGPPLRASLIEDVRGHPKIELDLKRYSPGSLAEIPVMVAGELWGFFSIGWPSRRSFDDADRRLFDAFASRASLAIQNAQLYDRAQVSASLEERQRIARELHDSVSQALYGIGLGARTLRRRIGEHPDAAIAEPLDYIIDLAEGGLAETRALIFELMPDSLSTDGLATALQRQAAATQARHGIKITAELCDEPELPVRSKEALYRIAQESLNNMAKHSGASSATVSLAATATEVTLVVRDDGCGFDSTGEFPGHLGLRSMGERALKVGGTYLLESVRGQGTTVTVCVPVTHSGRQSHGAE